jgi:hypothetical protein
MSGPFRRSQLRVKRNPLTHALSSCMTVMEVR